MRWNLRQPHEPWELFDELAREMNGFFPSLRGGERAVADLPLQIAQSDRGWEVQAALPGVDPSRLQIEVENGVLRIAVAATAVAAVSEPSQEQGGEVIRVERHQQSRERKLRLPDGVDPDGVTASTKNGVLRVQLPISVAAAPRRIGVQTED